MPPTLLSFSEDFQPWDTTASPRVPILREILGGGCLKYLITYGGWLLTIQNCHHSTPELDPDVPAVPNIDPSLAGSWGGFWVTGEGGQSVWGTSEAQGSNRSNISTTDKAILVFNG